MKNKKNNVSMLVSLIITLFTLIISNKTQAQGADQILIGHTIPDIKINEMVNYKTSSSKISDFKGKLLILDFWATYCAPCVGMFPTTDSLQNIFDGKVQFLSVTKEPQKKVLAFLNNMYNVRHFKPVSVVNDTSLSNLFYYSTIPYYVWIDPNGKVIATTSSEDINEKNISSVLTGKQPAFANRNDIRKRNIDIKQSLFILNDNFILKDSSTKRDELNHNDINSYSIATKYIENATNGQLVFDPDHFAAYNTSIDFLYRFAYDVGYFDKPVRGAFDSKSTHQFEVKDSLLNKLTDLNESKGYNEVLNWARKNAVCYEIYYPKSLPWKEKTQLVREDLERYFAKPMGFSVKVEKRIDSNLFILRRVGGGILLTTTGGSTEVHDNRYSYSQHNSTLSKFIGLLNSHYFQNEKASFVDKSGYNNIDLQLNCDMASISSINKALRKYGLEFQQTPSQVEVLVFSDKKN